MTKTFLVYYLARGLHVCWKRIHFISQATYKSNRGTVSGYFLAGRFMTWIPVSIKTKKSGLFIIIVDTFIFIVINNVIIIADS